MKTINNINSVKQHVFEKEGILSDELIVVPMPLVMVCTSSHAVQEMFNSY